MFSKKSKSDNKEMKQQNEFEVDRRFLVANWKCHKDSDEAKRWFDAFAEEYRPRENFTVIIAPTFLCLENISTYLKELNLPSVYLAAQDVSSFPRGGYTGAIAADMLKGMVDYVIVGHSERRRYFHETSQDVSNKVLEAVEMNITPIVCVDSSYAQSQLTVLNDLDTRRVIIGYGPVEALNFNIPQKPDKVEEAIAFISEIHPRYPVIYGGALHQESAAEYSSINGVSGLFVGSASLDPKHFVQIYNACQ